MHSRGGRPTIGVAALCAAMCVGGSALAQVPPSGSATSAIIAEVPTALTAAVAIKAKLVQVLQDWASTSDQRVKDFQRECGIASPAFSVGSRTQECAGRLAEDIASTRTAAAAGGGGTGDISLPSAAIVTELAQQHCAGTAGTVEVRGNRFFLICANGNEFEVVPNIDECTPTSADPNAPLVCTEWDVIPGAGDVSSSFCDTGLGTVVCYVLPAIVGAVAVTAGTLWVGTETGAIHGVIRNEGGAP